MFFVVGLLVVSSLAQGVGGKGGIGGNGGIGGGATAVPGPFNYNVEDFSTLTNGSAPTTTLLGTGMFPSLPSGMTFTVTNTNTDVKGSTAHSFLWPTFTLTGGAWANNTTLSLALTLGTAGDGIHYNFPSSGQAQTSTCAPIFTNWPQSAGSSSRVDLWDLDSSGAPFINTQLAGTAAPALNMLTECGGTATGGNCPAGEGTNGVFPTSTWQISCHYINAGTGTIGEYQALWDPPVGSKCDGTTCSNADGLLVSNSLISATGMTGGTTVDTEGFQIGTNGGNSGSIVYSGPEVQCGIQSGQTNCPFPVAPGLQLIVPTFSPGSGNYGSAQTVTLSEVSNAVSLYYTSCSTVGCTPATPTTSSTPYSGAFTATPPEAISAIAALTSYSNSAVSTADYVSPNAAYVSSAQCNSASATSCTISSLSIPSGDIIVVGNLAFGTLTMSDSNADTPSYGAPVLETTDNFSIRMAEMTAGATVTTITCTQTASGNSINCVAAWYSPGTLAGTLDQSAGADNPNTTAWSSGSTATLAGSSDLIVGFWGLSSTGITSTYSDGGTQRITCPAQQGCGLEDRTAWGTPGQAASGTWSGVAYGVAAVIAIK